MILIFSTPFKQIKIIKIPKLISIILTTIVASCTIIPDDALDYIPSSARIKSFTIEKYIGESSTPSDSYKAAVTYQGTFDNPSQIEIVWPSGMQPERIPAFDNTNKITKTIYNLSNWKVSKITNINSQNKTARIETFSYVGEKLKQHIQTNYYNGLAENTYTNDFFYKNESVDSVSQKLCLANGTCLANFFVYGLFERMKNGHNFIAGSGCASSSSEVLNCFSILDYIPQLPYSYNEGITTYFDNVTQSYYTSVNDYWKTHYKLSTNEDEYDSYHSQLFSTTILYDENGGCSQVVVLDTETGTPFDYTYETRTAYGYSSSIELWFANWFSPLKTRPNFHFGFDSSEPDFPTQAKIASVPRLSRAARVAAPLQPHCQSHP